VTALGIVSGAVIAAGEGSRLRELGVAKPLVEVAGAPLIAHVLDNFEAAGIASAAVIFNETERHCEAFVRGRYPDLVKTILVRSTRSSLESFRAVLAAAPPGRILVSTVDAFCPKKDFVEFVRRAEEPPADTTVLAVTRYVHDEKPLWVEVQMGSGVDPSGVRPRGRVSAIGGSGGDAVTAGIYVLPEAVRRLPIPSNLGRLREFLAWLASENHPIEAVEIEKVVDVDRPEDIAAAEELAGAGAHEHEGAGR
jgi:NDP-sugar pyrophosphorylase family protein